MVLGVGDAYSVDIAPCTRQDEDGKDGVGGVCAFHVWLG